MENTENQIPTPEPLNKEGVQMNMDEAKANVRSKASWFFWIAGLSLVNTFMAAKGSYFLVGLAISQLVDGVVIEMTGSVNYVISLLVPALFATFGYFAIKLQRWAFIVGSLVYFFDGIIYLFFQEWLAAGFHVFVLYKLYQGYKAITEYEQESARLA